MKPAFLLGLVAVTSMAAYLVGTRALRLPGCGLRRAAGQALACVGLAAVFFVLNLGLGIVTVLAARRLTGGFVSLFLADDVILLPLSLLQALLFAWWRAAAGR